MDEQTNRDALVDLAVGEWSCPCGLITVKELHGAAPLKVWCRDCGAGAEIMPLSNGR